MRNLLYLLPLALAFSCQAPVKEDYGKTQPKPPADDYIQLTGKAQGSTFSIIYQDAEKRSFENEVDSIFRLMDASLSTYVPDSRISKFNNGDSSFVMDDHFFKVIRSASYVWRDTDGAMDVTVFPLLKFWGFGGEKIEAPETIDTEELESIMGLIGMDKLEMILDDYAFNMREAVPYEGSPGPEELGLRKTAEGVMINFNALAQGYTSDVIADFLRAKGVKNLFVEVGGEVVAQGVNARGKVWTIGIVEPIDDPTQVELFAKLTVKDKAVATSGNYRKFYIKDGVKYPHSLDPKTGRPVQHSLLSATVVTDNGMDADAYATAFMVMGFEKAKAWLAENKGYDAYLIYADSDAKMQTYTTPGLEGLIEAATKEAE